MTSQHPTKTARAGRPQIRSGRSAGEHVDSDLLTVHRADRRDPRQRPSALAAVVLDGAAARPGQDLLDLSLGARLTSAALAAVVPGGGVTTLAPTRAALSQIRPTPENGQTWGSVWDLAERPLPLPDASFDAVIGFSVLAPLRHPRRMLVDIRRVLRPGGRLSVCELVLARRQPIELDGLSAHDVSRVEKAMAAVRPAAYAFTPAHAVGNARLAGLTEVEYTEDTVTAPLENVSAAEAALHAPGPAGESTYQVIGRTLGAAFARRYSEAWRSTARRRPILLHTSIAYITAIKPDVSP
ncbi:class I SAM-dependent methyltransferase [Frankia sp. R43]|uniref:class I SAM-dependent methyltransferase n=1 Tax=Frankia sp. R43 TaxID=269536 RepID=UPI0009FA309C|nr:methyltransferase domain-containing protein [Frankia sp. R43]